jgi:signal transduction histidine kinase
VQSLPKRDQIKALNHALKPTIDQISKKTPGIDMGYYSRDFDVILDGDNQHLNENFSVRRKRNFDDALETKNLVFEVLGQSENGQLECDINGLVKRLVQFFDDVHGGDMDISYAYRESLPPAMIDWSQIEQVLSNILYNAYQATDGKGRLNITTDYDFDRDMLVVTVKDNGCGIPEEVMPKMFEPFFSTKSKGTGLGLAIAFEIMEAHNGFIQVESQLGEGTTVKIYLPSVNRGENHAARTYS